MSLSKTSTKLIKKLRDYKTINLRHIIKSDFYKITQLISKGRRTEECSSGDDRQLLIGDAARRSNCPN